VSVLRLVERRFAGRYRCDARGRLLPEQGADRPEPPRFHLVRTVFGNLWRLRADVPRATATRLAMLAGREAPLGGTVSPPERLNFMRQALKGDGPIAGEHVGSVLVFPDVGATAGDPREEVRSLSPGDADALHPGLASCGVDAERLARPDCLGSWSGGRVVAVAHTRWGDGDEVGEVWVASAPTERRKGHARALAAAWCRRLRASGRMPLVSGVGPEAKAPLLRQGFGELGEDRWWV
jgi:hypothetical protein